MGNHWIRRLARLGDPVIPTMPYLGFPHSVHQDSGTVCPLFQRMGCHAGNGRAWILTNNGREVTDEIVASQDRPHRVPSR